MARKKEEKAKRYKIFSDTFQTEEGFVNSTFALVNEQANSVRRNQHILLVYN